MSLLGALIPAPVTIGHRVLLPSTGDGTQHAPAVPVPGCRVERVSRRHQNPDGTVVTLTALVWWPAAPAVSARDVVVVDGVEHRVEQVDEIVWLDGTVMHQEVFLS